MNSTAPADFSTELNRLVDRLRTMAITRLDQSWRAGESRAEAVRELARWCVANTDGPQRDWAAAIIDVGPVVVGDQLAVTAADLLDAPGTPEVLAAATERFRHMRLTL